MYDGIYSNETESDMTATLINGTQIAREIQEKSATRWNR